MVIEITTPAPTGGEYPEHTRKEQIMSQQKNQVEIAIILRKIQLAHPEHADSLNEVMEYISGVVSTASMAVNELEGVAKQLRRPGTIGDTEKMRIIGNAKIYADMLDQFLPPYISDGGDI